MFDSNRLKIGTHLVKESFRSEYHKNLLKEILNRMKNGEKPYYLAITENDIFEKYGNNPYYYVGDIKVVNSSDISSGFWYNLSGECYDILYSDKFYQWNCESLLDWDRFLYNELYWHEGAYETDNVQIEKGDVVIDAGANLGIFSLLAMKRGAKKVYSFEPYLETIKALRRNISINGYSDKQIEVVPFALDNFAGKTKFNINCGLPSCKIDENGSVEVNVIKIDDWIGSKKIDFIKADIEGSEVAMIEGARNTIEKQHPKLSLCTYHHKNDRKNLTKLIKDIDNSYRFEYSDKKMYAW